MKPIQMCVLTGDTVYLLMDDGTVWRGWQKKNRQTWEWVWERVPLPAKETP